MRKKSREAQQLQLLVPTHVLDFECNTEQRCSHVAVYPIGGRNGEGEVWYMRREHMPCEVCEFGEQFDLIADHQ